MDKLEEIIEWYRNLVVGNYSLWLIVVSAGDPTVGGDALDIQKKRINEMKQNDGIVVIPIGIGRESDMECLSQLMPGRNATGIFDVDFNSLFEDLGKSVVKVSKMVDGSGTVPTFNNDENDNVISNAAEFIENQQKTYVQNKENFIDIEILYG